MEFRESFVMFLYAAVGLLIVIKSVLFFRSTSIWSLGRYFYFTPESIYNSPNPQKERAKIMQNNFSVAIIIMAVFAAAVTLVFSKI